MTATHYTWQTLPNPFLLPEGSFRVSGRVTDIKNLITRRQSAVLLTGAPNIGKTTLIRCLHVPPAASWSWRQEGELQPLRELLALDHFFFVQIDLTPLEHAVNLKEMLDLFIAECIRALHQLFPHSHSHTDGGRKGLRDLLRNMLQLYFKKQHAELRLFFMLDAIERLGRFAALTSETEQHEIASPRDLGLVLLTECGTIRLLVDLIDEFSSFGVILSIDSHPLPVISKQFSPPTKSSSPERQATAERHISADLARFATMQLPIFSQKDALAFLAQQPEDFGQTWASQFRALDGKELFSAQEQLWILEQAGTHPYLLLQFCFHAFHLKQSNADVLDHWPELQDEDKKLLVEFVHQSVITFLTQLWERLQEALDKSDQETRNKFVEFIGSMREKRANEEIGSITLDWLGSQLRYILSNEGVIRYDMLSKRQPVFYPGALLRLYLLQQSGESSTSIIRGFWLTITLPESSQKDRLQLSELEYLLLKTLLQHPKRCPEDELMKGAWGETIERPKLTQRLHHLRKKLKDHTGNRDIIVNHYGGLYSLNHPEWLSLE